MIFKHELETQGLHVDVVHDLSVYEDAPRMASYDLIVPIWTMSQITEPQRKGLCAAVAAGAGLAGFHGGMCDAFRQDTQYQYMTGGQWVAHPGNIIDYQVQLTDLDHPIAAGLPRTFAMHSEQYYMHVDPGNLVLATTTFNGDHDPWIAGTVMPVVWIRMFDKGKVFFSSLGHVAADFDTPPVRELTRRGMLWALR